MDDDFLEIIPIDKDKDGLDVRDVLDGAKNGDLEYVLVLGQTQDGQWYFAASNGDMTRAVYTVDNFKHFIMSM